MKHKVEIVALFLVILTLSACNRGYGCPYGIDTDIIDFLTSMIPFIG